MRRSAVLLSILVVATLAACRRESITGSYGVRAVSGRVVMTDAAGTTPEGVEVSVAGTGMKATLGADGAFNFVGVPENAELTFRRSDGIDARLRVTSSSSVVIELAGKTATEKGGRRRGVSPKDTRPAQEIEGVIQSVGTNSLVILDSHKKEVTVALTDTTLIRKGNRTVAPADLKQGDRVHVKAMLKDNVLTALVVVVQTEDDDDKGKHEGEHDQEVEGTIVTAAADSLVVHDSHGNDVTIAITDATVIRKGKDVVKAADLKSGDRVHVKTAMVDGKLTALLVIVQQQKDDDGGRAREVEGTIVTAAADSITVHDSHGNDVKIALTPSTAIRKGNKKLTAADLKTGDRVHVKTAMKDNVLTATQVIVQDTGDHD